jgi:protein TonB
MLLLPTFNAILQPCSVSLEDFVKHPAGHFCSSCQRVVQDFSQSANPVADLAAARAASPDGRVCGTFRREQLVVPPAPTLSRRLRWFVIALVLVVGQGLTAREALAQVRKPVPHKSHPSAAKKRQTKADPISGQRGPTIEEVYYMSGAPLPPDETLLEEAQQPEATNPRVYTYVEQMPQLPSGGGQAAIVAYIQQRLRYPHALKNGMEGRVYASFIVGKDGLVREARIVRGLHPLLDAETIRAIQQLPAFTPGRQSGRAVDVSFTVPVSFKLK